MVQISNKRLDEYVSSKLSRLLFILLSNKRSKEEFDTVIHSIFSFTERIMILKRIGIIYLLLKDVKKYKIRKVVGVTRATLDKYNLIIEKSPIIFKKFKKIIKEEKIKNIFDEILNTLYGPGTPGVNWSSAWERRKKLSRKKSLGL